MISENKEMSRYRLKIAYDGIEADGEIDSDALGYALLALSNLFTEANSILNRAETNIKVKIKSNIKKGSFEVCFDVIQSLFDHCLCFLSSEKNYSAKDIAIILGLACGTTSGIIKILKWLKGQNFEVKEKFSNDRFIIKKSNGDELEIEGDALKLLTDTKIRKSMFGLIQPLKKQGIDRFEVRQDQTCIQQICKEDISSFDFEKLPEILISENISEKVCELLRICFEEDRSWKLFDGEQRFNATMCDLNFFKKIDSEKISFKKGDKFKMKIRTIQKDDGYGNIKSSYEMLEILEKYKSPQQMKFDI